MMLFLQRLLYQFLLWLALPFIPFRLFLRGLKERGYWRHIDERFGGGAYFQEGAVWIHAVSVGEARAAAPLVQRFLDAGRAVLVTCMTPAGRATAELLFGSRAHVRYLPYDHAWAIRRFLQSAKPALGVIMETELWPNLVRESNKAGFPLYLVNARMSERSAGGYRRFLALTGEVLQGFKKVAAQTADDARRLQDLGARNVSVTGNLKFDADPPQAQLDLGRQFREWFGSRPVWLAASTRDGEEKMILGAFKKANADVLLVLVPRHPQRFDEVGNLVRMAGFSMQRRSESMSVHYTTQVWLGDSLGEMFAYYAAADCALIGGSLLPYGGQNLIEACAVGCPVLVGPYTENFKEVAEEAIAQGAALRAANTEDWVVQAAVLSENHVERHHMGEAGRQFSAAHKGAADKAYQLVSA